MKKLMVAACAIAFAAVSQAAVVNWQVGSINGPGANGKGWGDTPIGATVTAQLLVGTALNGTELDMSSLVVFTEGDSAGLGDIDGGYFWGATDDALLEDGTAYYAQVLLTSGDSTLASQVVQLSVSGVSHSADPAFAWAEEAVNVDPIGGQTFDPVYGTFSAAGWEAAAVPEPTSGLLLLLGVAGLALRRRRA